MLQVTRIGEGWVSVYVSKTELKRRKIIPGEITQKQARAVLKAAGLPENWRDVDVELYPGREELLLFVRCADSTAWYAFSDLEQLLGAAGCMPEENGTALYVLDGGYILGLSGGKSAAAEEFGRSVPAGRYYEAYLREHGKVLFGKNAISRLRAAFL